MKPKFIQYNDDCNWAFGLNRMMLNMLGVWPNGYKVVYLKNLRVPFMLAWILICLILPQIYALVKVCPNVTLITDNLYISSPGLFTLVKLFLVWNNRQAFEPLIHWMTADWTRDKASWERKLMLRQARYGRLFTMSGYVIMMSSIACFMLSPFFGIDLRLVNNITDHHERRYFPLQTYYPYDFVESPNFELTYVAQLIAIAFAGISFSAADNFFGVLVLHAAGQCKILTVELTKLFEGVGFDEKLSFKAKLSIVVDRHAYLVRFVVTIEKTFSILVLAHTISLSVTICCVGYGLITYAVEDSASLPIIQLIMHSMALLNVMLHMLVYCAATEILTTNSATFVQAIFNSDWFLYPAEYSRDVIPLMMRSQYPLRLTVGKFFDLSLNAYAKILKSLGGYISMLLAVS